MECAQYGTPIVLSAVFGLPEHWSSAFCPSIFDNCDPNHYVMMMTAHEIQIRLKLQANCCLVIMLTVSREYLEVSSPSRPVKHICVSSNRLGLLPNEWSVVDNGPDSV